MRNFAGKEFIFWRKRVYDMRQAGWDWQKIRNHRANEADWIAYRDGVIKDEIFPPASMTFAEREEFIDFMEAEEGRQKPIDIPNSDFGENDRAVPDYPASCWQLYREKLLEKGFSDISVESIEESSHMLLNKLNAGNGDKLEPVKGMVVGNVQSGKTANMGALMSMAADFGWNVCIVLSGTIENLRKQSMDRLNSDMKSGNLVWFPLDNPKVTGFTDPCKLDFSESSRVRYRIVCLKNSARLASLLRWLNHDKNQKAKMRVLLIDDEADQASLNVNPIDIDERTKINQLITSIVNGSKSIKENAAIFPYKAMNYVAYTATPYGNFLNEAGRESLYPRDFIVMLPTPDIYLGPKEIFGERMYYTSDGMPIVNIIPSEPYNDDAAILNKLSKDNHVELPVSLKKAIAWFCCCVAMQRVRKYKKPVSMLIHHSTNTSSHAAIGHAVRKWLHDIPCDKFLSLCKDTYIEQTEMMDSNLFYECCPTYGRSIGLNLPYDIIDYEPFDDLKDIISELQKGVQHITLDDDKKLIYGKGIHLCIDNCKYDMIVDGKPAETVVRLMYPDKNCHCDTDAPAFLVIGGLTLSRGLTIEGLVSTYFSRKINTADTLMQTGRWFGYRVGYELLPRIWLTRKGCRQMEYLSDMDTALRQDLMKYRADITPDQYGPVMRTFPGLAIAARNKMQGAVVCEINFNGAHLQTIIFKNDEDILRTNYNVADKFITLLEVANPTLSVGKNCKLWKNIKFDYIWNELLNKMILKFSSMDSLDMLKDWIDCLSKDRGFDRWNICLIGRNNSPEFHEIGMVYRTRRLSGGRTADSDEINFGVLTDPNEWKSDFAFEEAYNKLDNDDKAKYDKYSKGRLSDVQRNEFNDIKEKIREHGGVKDIPRLCIYCVNKDSKYNRSNLSDTAKDNIRADLKAKEHIIGVSISIPGSRTEFKNSVSINLKN